MQDPTKDKQLDRLSDSPSAASSTVEPCSIDQRNGRLSIGLTILLSQLGIVALGVLLGWLFGLFPQTPLLQTEAIFNSAHWLGKGTFYSTLIGIGVAFSMFLAIYILSLGNFAWFPKIEQLVGASFLKLLRQQSITYILLLCVLAGVGEELLFRWAIQGGLEKLLLNWLTPSTSFGIAVLCSSILFGLAHFLTRAYFVLASLIGVLLSLSVYLGGGLWAAILAHALYDYLALAWMLRR